MSTLKIEGIEIKFPYTPYQCQIQYMRKVIQCLNESFKSGKFNRNALLESPTGTGKTMSLICSTLAWLQAHKNQSGEKLDPSPKIIYATRTHTQIHQIVSELKDCAYVLVFSQILKIFSHKRPDICVLGSRKHLCTKYSTDDSLTSSTINKNCYRDIKNGACPYISDKFRLERFKLYGVRDIEDIVSEARDNKYCAYFFQRAVQIKRAHMIIMPYNYLIDPVIRKRVDLDLRNCVLVFDEAHNVEKLCESVCSFQFSSMLLARSVQEIKRLRNHETAEKFVNCLLDCDVEIDEKFKKLKPGEEEIIEGSFLSNLFYDYVMLDGTKLHFGTYEGIVESLSRLCSVIRSRGGNVKNLRELLDIFTRLYSSHLEDETLDEHFKIVITRDDPIKQYNSGVVDYLTERKDRGDRKVLSSVFKIHFLCLTPSIATKLLVEQSPLCMILTSGTLSPLKTYASEMGVSFPICLENPHVIKKNQLLSLVVCQGPMHQTFDSTFGNRNNPAYHHDLGCMLTNVLNVVPDGVLVFFPSSDFMRMCMTTWKRGNRYGKQEPIFTQFSKLKQVFVEPRDARRTADTIRRFEKKIERKDGGAVFLAVCRGKVSEGMDFSGRKCRCVVMIGMPFPPKNNYTIRLKRQYLDVIEEKQLANEPNEELRKKKMKQGLSMSKSWYSQQSARAVNQAIGRVIRNRNDFGVMMLADHRFCLTSHRNNLSRWISPHVKIHKTFGNVRSTMTGFFKRFIREIKSNVDTTPQKKLVASQDKIFLGMSGGSKSAAEVTEFQKTMVSTQSVPMNVSLKTYYEYQNVQNYPYQQDKTQQFIAQQEIHPNETSMQNYIQDQNKMRQMQTDTTFKVPNVTFSEDEQSMSLGGDPKLNRNIFVDEGGNMDVPVNPFVSNVQNGAFFQQQQQQQMQQTGVRFNEQFGNVPQQTLTMSVQQQPQPPPQEQFVDNNPVSMENMYYQQQQQQQQQMNANVQFADTQVFDESRETTLTSFPNNQIENAELDPVDEQRKVVRFQQQQQQPEQQPMQRGENVPKKKKRKKRKEKRRGGKGEEIKRAHVTEIHKYFRTRGAEYTRFKQSVAVVCSVKSSVADKKEHAAILVELMAGRPDLVDKLSALIPHENYLLVRDVFAKVTTQDGGNGNNKRKREISKNDEDEVGFEKKRQKTETFGMESESTTTTGGGGQFCGFCKKNVNELYILPCRHTGCKICLTRWIEMSGSCAMCKAPVNMDDIKKIFFSS